MSVIAVVGTYLVTLVVGGAGGSYLSYVYSPKAERDRLALEKSGPERERHRAIVVSLLDAVTELDDRAMNFRTASLRDSDWSDGMFDALKEATSANYKYMHAFADGDLSNDVNQMLKLASQLMVEVLHALQNGLEKKEIAPHITQLDALSDNATELRLVFNKLLETL